MSKAFTKDDAAEAPLVRPPPRLQPGEIRYVTAAGFRRFEQELQALTELRAADRTEVQQQRVAWLSALLPLLTVAPPPEKDTVGFGARVELEDDGGEQRVYRIVGPDEVDPAQGDISVEAPLARALLGKSAGDTVTWRRPRGDLELLIRGVGRDG